MVKKNRTILSFLKYNWEIFLFLFLLIGVTYYPKVSNYNYSIDTERMIRFPDYTLHWWLRLGRYGLVALTKLSLFGKGTSIIYINVLTYVLLFLSVIVLIYVFDTNEKRGKTEIALASGIYCTTPIILEQTNFVLQSAPVVFSSITMLIGYGFLKKYLVEKKLRFFILGIILEAFSFSVYVSLIMGFIALVIVDLCYNSRVEAWKTKKYLFRVFYMASSSIISYIVYLLGNKVIFRFFNLKSSDYLSESKLWGNVPFHQVISTIKNSVINNFKLDSPFIFCGSLVLLAIFLFTSIANKENMVVTLITTVGIIIIGTYTIPLFGYFGTLRSYFPVYPIILYGLTLNIFQCINFNLMKRSVYILLSVIIIFQSYNTFLFGINEGKIYTQEVALVNDIRKELERINLTDYQNFKLAVIGGRTFEEVTHGDMLGNSVFTWDLNGNVGVSYRAGDFIYNHGLRFQRVTPEDYKRVSLLTKDMDLFPNESSIKVIGNIVILRLS